MVNIKIITSHSCIHCQKICRSAHGLRRHIKSCLKNPTLSRTDKLTNISESDNDDTDPTPRPDQHHTTKQNLPNLPQYIPLNRIPKHPWLNISNTDFVKQIDKTYDIVITWRKNLFKLPSGKAVKVFIKELTFWLEQFNIESQYEGIALKVFMLLLSLLLQKPSKSSKAKDNLKKLKERLKFWNEGDIASLVK